MGQPITEELLILTKTYPSPSATYRETTCVAAINRQGEMRRLFPVPYRLLEGTAQFKKWEWITARLTKPTKDHRPESHRLDADSISRSGDVIKTTGGNWSERLHWIEPHIVENFAALETRRLTSGQTLGFLRASRIVELRITPVKQTDWTEADKIELSQDGLFDTHEVKSRPRLRKLPFDFHHKYESAISTGVETNVHKLVDWEVGALYWNCFQDYGTRWEEKLRQKLETDFARKDLLFLMGTIHRFPDQWLIVGIVYPPRPPQVRAEQLGLTLGQ
jgi:hypothetical protein